MRYVVEFSLTRGRQSSVVSQLRRFNITLPDWDELEKELETTHEPHYLSADKHFDRIKTIKRIDLTDFANSISSV